MEKVTLEGKVYVKASTLAREFGYTSDYVGQLCREDKVDAKLLGRSWYVNKDSLEEHKSSRYRSTKAKSQQALQENIQQKRSSVATQNHTSYSVSTHTTPRSSGVYKEDVTELLPTLLKKTDVYAPTELSTTKVDARADVENEELQELQDSYSVPIRVAQSRKPNVYKDKTDVSNHSIQSSPRSKGTKESALNLKQQGEFNKRHKTNAPSRVFVFLVVIVAFCIAFSFVGLSWTITSTSDISFSEYHIVTTDVVAALQHFALKALDLQ